MSHALFGRPARRKKYVADIRVESIDVPGHGTGYYAYDANASGAYRIRDAASKGDWRAVKDHAIGGQIYGSADAARTAAER